MMNTPRFLRSKPTCLKQSHRGKIENDVSGLKIYLTSRKSVEFATWKILLKKATAKTRWENLSFYWLWTPNFSPINLMTNTLRFLRSKPTCLKQSIIM